MQAPMMKKVAESLNKRVNNMLLLLLYCLFDSAERSCEKMWRMPFIARYRDMLDSKCADINNTATKGKGGGAITAAVFLKEFVDKVLKYVLLLLLFILLLLLMMMMLQMLMLLMQMLMLMLMQMLMLMKMLTLLTLLMLMLMMLLLMLLMLMLLLLCCCCYAAAATSCCC